MARPALPIGVLGDIGVVEQVADGHFYRKGPDGEPVKGNIRWRSATAEDPPGMRRRWQARALYRDKTGKQRRIKRLSNKSGTHAKVLLKSAWQDTVERLQLERPAAALRVKKLAEQWWDHFDASNDVLKQTKDQYRDALDDHVIPTFGELKMVELDSSVIYDGLETLAEGALSRARISRIVLKHLCTFAVRQGVLPVNPVNDDIPTYKGRAAAPMALTADQYRDIRQALIAWQSASHMGPKRSKSILDILDFMVATGCRSGEALAVRWEDVDLQAGLVTFSGTIVEPRKGSPAHRQPHTKTEAGFRTVHVGSSTIAMLTRRASEYAEAPNEHGLVFPNARGGIFAPNNFRTRLRDALKFGDLEGFYPYLLRKTAARKIRDDVNLDAASAQLGHSSTAVTSKHYAGAVRNAPDVSDVMEEFLKASKT